ncbi:DEAD/DEAH box helicase [Sporichthya brevicatena]|uniref:DEAD/DEAH box helicase n=1 Tax=Sporichthya brevicatena TaxID=171442 RepID=A0ABN1H498_9ACTN
MEPGLYDRLLTQRLRAVVADLQQGGVHIEVDAVADVELARVLARHVGDVLAARLRELSPEEATALANEILRAVGRTADEAVPTPAQVLRAVVRGLPGSAIPYPEIPLGQSDLLVNGRDEPHLARAITGEIPSADRIDVLLAFIKWSGLRLFGQELKAAIDRGAEVRVLTTTYLGSTERRALDFLADIGAQIAVSYESRSTRLHAKAWLFTRNSGYHTAYVGSSNLSISAMVDGQEWNVRLSSVETPHLIEKFRATIDSYWADRFHGFEPYDPARDGDRFDEAIHAAGGSTGSLSFIVPSIEVRPYPFQQEILEALDVEREVHGRWRNLVVAATGTGKTVIAALDYRRLRGTERFGADPSLLFIAHRREILEQSQRTFATVLGDGAFGEQFLGGARPRQWRHVFASVQSLARVDLSQLEPGAFDIVIVDEFHHSEAATYTRLLQHLQPKLLLGMTATPERADGKDVTHWFGGHIAAELRLWEALERDLLCPFHYFGVHDMTDLKDIDWRAGRYDLAQLDSVISGDTVRARIALNAVADKVPDPRRMRALGFCVSRAHAHFMAKFFADSGIPALAVDAETREADRTEALRQLRDREINVVFAVDLFNEGVDIPAVDTVLMLRPTESATVFLQQLGRGLRRADGKDVLTVIDLVGFQHRKFRFDLRYRALTGVSRAGLAHAVEHGFPYLPPGCHIELDRQAQEAILQNLRDQLRPNVSGLAREVASYGDVSLREYLEESGRELVDLYSGAGNRSWTALRRRAGLPTPPAGPAEEALLRRLSALLCVDDKERIQSYRTLLRGARSAGAAASERELRLARMLFFTFWPVGGGFPSYDAAFAQLRAENPAVCAEALELLDLAEERIAHVPLHLVEPALADVPLQMHARYTREEMLAGVGQVRIDGPKPHVDRSGVRWVEAIRSDVLNITVRKNEAEYSPTTMYRDYAMSPSLFHWESQSTTSADSPTGRRYVHHQEQGSSVLLFVRETKTNETGSTPYLFLGPATYVSSEGSRPISIVWRLRHDMPADFYQGVRLLSA